MAETADHSSDDGRSEDATRYGAGATGEPERQKAENEGERSHQDRTQT